MRVKALTLAVVAIMALPVSASQFLAGTVRVSTRPSAAAPGAGSLSLLLQDPFLFDALSYAPPSRLRDLDPPKG